MQLCIFFLPSSPLFPGLLGSYCSHMTGVVMPKTFQCNYSCNLFLTQAYHPTFTIHTRPDLGASHLLHVIEETTSFLMQLCKSSSLLSLLPEC